MIKRKQFSGSLLKTIAMLVLFCGIAAVIGCGGRCDKMKQETRERSGAVTMKGKPLTLLGNELRVGDMAPDVELTANDLSGL